MRRLMVVVSTMALSLLVAGGVALAATVHCPNDPSQGSPTTGLYCFGTAMDTMHGYSDIDTLEGGKGSDHVYGDAGADNSLWGGALVGGSYTDDSTDYVHGGRGNDTIYGGLAQGGVDRLYGERGNDFIDASQRHQENFKPVTKEIIDCGTGAQDEVYFDKGVDVVKNCEIMHPF